MNKSIIVLFLLIGLISCSGSDEYELPAELKEKAQKVKNKSLGIEEEIELTQESSPAWVPEQIFKAANTGDVTLLKKICSSALSPEGKAKRICEVPSTPQNDQEKFMEYFKLGKVVGEPKVNGDKATVDILIGYDGKAPETLELVKQNGKWYLFNF